MMGLKLRVMCFDAIEQFFPEFIFSDVGVEKSRKQLS